MPAESSSRPRHSLPKKPDRPRQLAVGAAVVAAGVLLPIIFHQVGLGPVFLPMFFPIALGSFVMRPWPSAFAGMVTPMVSTVLTGMPALMPPVAPVLSVELGIFGATVSLLYRAGLQPLPTLLVAFFLNRILLLFLAFGIAPVLGLPPHWTGWAAVVYGLPGIALITLSIPLILPRLGQYLEV
jgi:hypothetical protein